MHRDHGVLVGVRGLDFRSLREFGHQLLPNREQLPGEGGNCRIREPFARDDVMGEADRLHLIFGFGGRAAEGTGGNVG